MNETSINKTLEEYNSEYRQQYIGAMVLLIILMVLGIAGNVHVLFLYTYRMKQTNQRVFILTIAVLDTVLCFLGIPFILVTMFMPLTFKLVPLCKTMRFIIYFCAGNSGTILVLIALNRYLKTCRPLGYQITPKVAKRLCLGAVSFGCSIFWPAPVMYGNYKVTTPDPAIIGSGCDIDHEFMKTVYPTVWNLFMAGTVALFLLILIFLYYKIGVTISRRLKHGLNSLRRETEASESSKQPTWTSYIADDKSGTSCENDSRSPSNNDNVPGKATSIYTTSNITSTDKITKSGELHSTISPVKTMSQMRLNEFVGTGSKSNLESAGTEETKIGNNAEPNSKESSFSPKPRGPDPDTTNTKKIERIRRSRRITLMFFVLTAVYFVTFIPHLAMQLAFFIQTDFVHNLSSALKVVYHVVYNFAFINSSVNCYVYSFFDLTFRQELKKMYTRDK